MPHTDDICDRPGLLGIDAALNIALASVAPISGKEMVSLGNCARRITAEDIVSSMPLPPFDQSAVDGYGIQDHDVRTRNTGPFRLAGMVVAGSHSAPVLAKGEVIRLLTGAAVPEGVGAVVMDEMATVQGTSMVIGKPAEARLNIRRRGEDVGPCTVIVEGGTLIDARRVAIFAASGIAHIPVRRRINVAVLSTGSELISAGKALDRNQIYDSNGPMLGTLLSSPALKLRMLGCCPDDPRRLARQIGRAARSFDLLVCSGGISGSDADHIVASVIAAGGRCDKVSLALKPGKPLAIGRVEEMAVLALPGNPVAALVGALLFARPMLQKLAGQVGSNQATILARTASMLSHRLGRAEFVPVRVTGHDADGVLLLEKLGRGGSARLYPLVLADGLASVPAEHDDLPAGAPIHYYPFRTAFTL